MTEALIDIDPALTPLRIAACCLECGGCLSARYGSEVDPARSMQSILRCQDCDAEFVIVVSMAPRRPFPLQPALELAASRNKPEPGDQDGPMGMLADHLALRWGVTQGGARRWGNRRRLPGLTADEADRVALSFGMHPANIWPEWWDVARGLVDA